MVSTPANSHCRRSRFAVVIGLSDTKKDPEVSLDALLDTGDVSAVLFQGGGDLAGDTPYPSNGSQVLHLVELGEDGSVTSNAELELEAAGGEGVAQNDAMILAFDGRAGRRARSRRLGLMMSRRRPIAMATRPRAWRAPRSRPRSRGFRPTRPARPRP